jgi:hypothetical protein
MTGPGAGPTEAIAEAIRAIAAGTIEWAGIDDEIQLRRPVSDGARELEAEAWSWSWLEGDDRLPESAQRRLVELGWRQTAEPEPHLQYVGNYVRHWDMSSPSAAEDVAQELVSIVRDVYNTYWASRARSKAKFGESWQPRISTSAGGKGRGCLGGAAAGLVAAVAVAPLASLPV